MPRWVIMTLIEAVRDLEALDWECTIYAAEPWTENSETIVVPAPKLGGLPSEAERLHLKEFLEVSLVRSFFDGWMLRDVQPTLQKKCAALIKSTLAIHDGVKAIEDETS